jgi:hypothetical protein
MRCTSTAGGLAAPVEAGELTLWLQLAGYVARITGVK